MPTSDTNPAIETTPAKAAQAPQGESALDGVALPDDPVAAILEVLRRGERFLVCSHSRPDGDALSHDTVATEAAPVDGMSLEDNERSLLVRALEKTNGNQTQAARLLRVTRDTLRYKMKKFNLR